MTNGTLNINGTTLTIQGSINRNGTSQVGQINASGASSTIEFKNASAMTVPLNTFTGDITNLTASGTGSITFNSTRKITGTLTLSNSGGITIGASGNLVVNGTLSRSNGSINASATGATLTFGGTTKSIPASSIGSSIYNLVVNMTTSSDVLTMPTTTNNSTTITGTFLGTKGVMGLAENFSAANCVTTTNYSTTLNTKTYNCSASGAITGGVIDELDLSASSNSEVSTTGDLQVNSLKISNGKRLALGLGKKLTITGTITMDANSGIKGTSSSDIEVQSTGQTLYFDQTSQRNTNALRSLKHNANGTLTIGNPVYIYGDLDVESGGTLTTSNNIVVGHTGRIANLSDNTGGSIDGPVTVELEIGSKGRGFRFLANPFKHNISVSQLTDDIDITGINAAATPTSGQNNGFTFNTAPGATNNPSAFWFDASNGSNTTGTNNGWTAFTNTPYDTTGSNAWKAGQSIRVLIRGTKGQGLSGGTYTYTAPTIDLTGYVNDKNGSTNLSVAASVSGKSDFEMITNPYISPVTVANPTKDNLLDGYWVWDVNKATRGGYSQYFFTSGSAGLPKFAGIIVQRTSTTSPGSLQFSETMKTTSAAGLFKTSGNYLPNAICINVSSDSIHWDRYALWFKENSSIGYSREEDVFKFENPEYNIYSVVGGQSVSTESRPTPAAGEFVQLKNRFPYSRSYSFNFNESDIPANVFAYLRDGYLNKEMPINKDLKYTFDVDTSNASGDIDRFSMLFKSATGAEEFAGTKGAFSLFPNPATDKVLIEAHTSDRGTYQYQLIDQLGALVKEGTMDFANQLAQEITVADLQAGVYFVRVLAPNRIQVLPFVK